MTNKYCRQAWRREHSDILKYNSVDELMVLRWMRMRFHLFLAMSCLSLPILTPLYSAGEGFYSVLQSTLKDYGDHAPRDIRTLTYGNILYEEANERWATFAMQVIFTYIFCKLIHIEAVKYHRMTIEISHEREGAQRFSVVCNDVPVKSVRLKMNH